MTNDIDLGLGLLDHQLLDADGRRCGKVDDLELDGDAVVAIVTGAAGWRGRGIVGRLFARIAPGSTVRIPWDEVATVDSAVHLRREARELRLGRGDDRALPLVERIPGSSL